MQAAPMLLFTACALLAPVATYARTPWAGHAAQEDLAHTRSAKRLPVLLLQELEDFSAPDAGDTETLEEQDEEHAFGSVAARVMNDAQALAGRLDEDQDMRHEYVAEDEESGEEPSIDMPAREAAMEVPAAALTSAVGEEVAHRHIEEEHDQVEEDDEGLGAGATQHGKAAVAPRGSFNGADASGEHALAPPPVERGATTPAAKQDQLATPKSHQQQKPLAKLHTQALANHTKEAVSGAGHRGETAQHAITHSPPTNSTAEKQLPKKRGTLKAFTVEDPGARPSHTNGVAKVKSGQEAAENKVVREALDNLTLQVATFLKDFGHNRSAVGTSGATFATSMPEQPKRLGATVPLRRTHFSTAHFGSATRRAAAVAHATGESKKLVLAPKAAHAPAAHNSRSTKAVRVEANISTAAIKAKPLSAQGPSKLPEMMEFDTNTDGILEDREVFDALMFEMKMHAVNDAKPADSKRSKPLVKKFLHKLVKGLLEVDTNRDGIITRSEFYPSAAEVAAAPHAHTFLGRQATAEMPAPALERLWQLAVRGMVDS